MATDKPATPAAFPLSRCRVHGDTVYVSGQVPVRGAVVEAGSSLEQILKCLCYVRRESDMPEFNRIYREFFGGGTFPARTTLIANPPNPRVLIEIEAIAALGSR
ncbi:MAG TPA: RidA family protein [Burkholderiales bacterium]|nr:RidA family protein [Burkholderiales bacterium]